MLRSCLLKRPLYVCHYSSSAGVGGGDDSGRPAGTELWHGERPVSGSAGRTYAWPTFNERIHPPGPDFETGKDRPAYVCHMRALIKYSPWKMWYIATMVRGLSVDEALKQLTFVSKKGAVIAKEVIEEAQELAVKEHNVEFKSNLWVAESFANKGDVIKGLRRHARGRMGKVEYFYTNYFVKLEEGKPPKDYHEYKKSKSPEEWLEHYVGQHRKKTIPADHR